MFSGVRTERIRPSSSSEPLMIRTMPPVATVSGSDWKFHTSRASAAASSSVSESIAQNSG